MECLNFTMVLFVCATVREKTLFAFGLGLLGPFTQESSYGSDPFLLSLPRILFYLLGSQVISYYFTVWNVIQGKQ